MSKIIILLVILITFGFGAWYLVSNNTFSPTKLNPFQKTVDLKVGILAPLSGNLADYGTELRNGAALAADELNAQGGVNISFDVKDEKGDPELAKTLATELSNDKTVSAVIGPITSGNALVAGPIFQNNKLVMISPAATNPKITDLGDYIYRVCPSDAQQGVDLAHFAVEARKAQRIAIMVDIDEGSRAYSEGLADVFTAEMAKLGVTPALTLNYKTGDTNFSAQSAAIKKAGDIDLIFIPGYSAEAALISQQLKKDGLNITVVGGDGVGEGVTNGKVISLGGNAVEGLISTAFFDTKNPNSDVQKFVKDYTERFGSAPSWVAANAYDAMKILANAAKKGGSVDREVIKNQVSATRNFKSLGREISFNEDGDVSTPIMKIIIKNGSYEILH